MKRLSFCPCWLAFAITVACCPLLAQDSADRDYSAELKRIPPTEPAQALATFDVAPGYKLELAAAEPLVTSPVAAAFDEDGRLYVVEMRDYSEQDKEKLGRVRLLEDTNGDGTFDKSKIFVDGLSWPTAIACYDGGIFVGAAPEILYFKDAGGDGVPEIRNIVFTGFGRGNVQGLLNSFTWGLDNRIHVAVSSAGANLQSVSAVGVPQGQPLSLRGRDFAFDPRDPSKFVATSGGGQHGLSFDDFGRKFVCSNSDHLQLIMLDDEDLARNPYLIPPNPRISIATDGPQADVFRISPVEPWREVRTRLRKQGIVPGVVEGGGRAAGYFTSATGVTIYRGNAWPKADRGVAIVGDVGGNLIHRKRLVPDGLELKAERVDKASEFIASRDTWFRPVQFLNGPDGALYVLDMYREVIEHPASLPPVIKKHLDLTSGRDRGRIYRVVPTDFKRQPQPQLSKATTAELVASLASDNAWHRETAARLLYQKQDMAAVEPLKQLLSTSESPLARLHALYALRGLGQHDVFFSARTFEDADPQVHVHALRIARRWQPLSKAGVESVLAACTHDNIQVRLEGALGLGDIPDPRRLAMAVEIAKRDTDNRWLQAAVGSSFVKDGGKLWVAMLSDPDLLQNPAARPWLDQLARQASAQTRSADRDQFGPLLDDLAAKDPAAFSAAIISLASSRNYALLRALPDFVKEQKTKNALHNLVTDAQRDLVKGDLAAEQRAALVPLLALQSDSAAANFLNLLTVNHPPEVQRLALEGWTSLGQPDAREVVRRLPQFSPALREQAMNGLVSRDDWAAQLLTAIDAKVIEANQLSAAQWDALARRGRPIRTVAERMRPAVNSNRALLISDYQAALAGKHDLKAGAELFKKHCSTCHKVGDVGTELGPSLAAMKSRGAEAILTNVLDPNREVNPQFVNYSALTKDGRVLSGMLAAETATSLTFKRGDNQQDTVLRIEIEELKNTGLSLMPEGLERQLDKQQMADLIAFLLQASN